MSKWKDKELNFLKDNYLKYTKKELSELLNKTPNAIQIKANRLGLKRDKKYYYNKDFFKNIINSEQSYWLGFLYADGYVTQSKNNYCVGIELQYKDTSHLKKFNKSLNGNLNVEISKGHIGNIDGREIKGSMIAKLRIFSKDMMNDLISHGCCKNKSLIKDKPIGVPELLMKDFIRGYFDGNGTITHSYNKNVDKSYLKVTIETGSYKFAQWLSDYLNNIGYYNNFYKDNKNSYKIQLSAKCNKDFLVYMYNNSEIYLDRKYNKYISAVYGQNVV